ncbi:MAG: carboxypeptidase regulatory-like domain-containing protein [Bryobacteraceae bacterium]
MKARIVPAAAAALLIACGGSGPANESNRDSKKAGDAAAAPVSYFKVDPATAGTLSGKVSFTGAKPARKQIIMESEADCEKLHKGPVLDPAFQFNANGTLGNVFVYIKGGLEGKQFEPVTAPVQFDQKGCMFAPRVFGLRVGQPMQVSNSDPVTHNVHPLAEKNREWNQGQPPGTPAIERKFAAPEIMIPIKCNVHAWMRAYGAVMEHPYFAVTGDTGTFEIKNVPPGEYTLEAWHEKLPAQQAKVTVGPGGAVTADFTFKGE